MMKPITLFCLVLVLLSAAVSFASDDGLVAWWKFDDKSEKTTVDSISRVRDEIDGNFKYVSGVSGSGIKCDGFSTRVIRQAEDAPHFTDAFTIEAWIVPQAYPWNWCAIVNQEEERKAGYFFGIDETGHVGLQLAINGRWRECTSKEAVPFMEKWSHIAGAFNKNTGVTIYIDGEVVGRLSIRGRLTFADDMDVALKINGRQIRRGKDFRFGHRRMLEGTDLIMWIKMDSAKPLLIELAPSGS